MGALSDRLLARGCIRQLDVIHGEPVVILSTGKTFTAVREVEQDIIMQDMDGQDRRAKIILHFSTDPGIGMTGIVKTDDGKKWRADIRQESSYLTTDYELVEITDKDQI